MPHQGPPPSSSGPPAPLDRKPPQALRAERRHLARAAGEVSLKPQGSIPYSRRQDQPARQRSTGRTGANGCAPHRPLKHRSVGRARGARLRGRAKALHRTTPQMRRGEYPRCRQSASARRRTAWSDRWTFSAGETPPMVSAIRPSGVTMKVVRSAKPCPISMPRVSFIPGRASATAIP